jgi:hypothetical protein
MVEYRLAVAKDEIDIALDKATLEVLARGRTRALGTTPRCTLRHLRKECPDSEYANVREDLAVSTDQQGHGLRALRKLRMSSIEVVHEGDVFGQKVSRQHVHGGRKSVVPAVPALLSATTTDFAGILVRALVVRCCGLLMVSTSR